MKKIIILFTSLLLSLAGSAQKYQEQNLYMLNPFLINPAFAGSSDGIFAMAGFRNQFTGSVDGPRNLYLSAHAPVGNKSSLGGNFFTDRRGVLNSFYGSLSSSYLVNVSSNHQLRFGLSGGIFRQSIMIDQLKNASLSDPTLSSDNQNFYNYNFGFGVAYKFKNLQAGVSLPHLGGEEKYLRNFTAVYASYNIYTADTLWKITPTVLYQQIPVSANQIDIQLRGTWKEFLWAQAGYRSNGSILLSAGLLLENIGIAYAYAAPTGQLAQLSKGGHEIGLIFTLKNKNQREKLTELTEKDNKQAQTTSIDTTKFMEKFDEINSKLSIQQHFLDSLMNTGLKDNKLAIKQVEELRKSMAGLQEFKMELASYLNTVNNYQDYAPVDSLENFNNERYNYYVALGTYQELNFVKFIQKQLMQDHFLSTTSFAAKTINILFLLQKM